MKVIYKKALIIVTNISTKLCNVKTRRMRLGFILFFLFGSLLSANAQLTNIPVTGFTNDLVANGIGNGTGGTTLNTATTGNMIGMVTQPTIGVDGVGYTFIDATYKWYSGSTAPTCYLPTGGAIPSALTSGLTYQLQSYSAANAMSIASNTYTGSVWPTTGTLTLATPTSYSNLYVLYESVMNTAGPTITATVTFTDATTQVFSANSVVNWFTATNVAYTPSISRAQNVAAGAANACATGPYLFQLNLPISAGNLSKLVQSISFNWSAATGTAANTVDYFHALAVGGNTPCVGTPTPGNTIASANPICPSINFTLSTQNSAAGGSTFQWQSSPDGIAWTNVSGATSSTLTTSQTTATYYQCVVTCTSGPSTGTSNPVFVTMSASNTCYCTPTTTGGTTYYISNFTTTGGATNINNTSGSSAGYQNFSATASMSAMPGTTVNFTMTIAGGSTYGKAIWVDWNQNGTFDASEQVASSTAYASSPISGSFTVPLTATSGTTRMRILTSFTPSNPSNPCVGTGSGEFEDYAFVVIPLPLCSGTPAPGNTIASANPACASTTFTLSLQNTLAFSGLTYQWQSSPDGIAWTNMSGGTASTLSTTQTTTTYYQCLVTCSAGSSTGTSTPLLVTVAPTLNGTYTINSAVVTGGTNFQSFTAFKNLLNCSGVTGPVIVNVVAGSGPYNEQVEFGVIPGASATNTITINGNGNTLTSGSGSATVPSTLGLNGTDYMTINNLIVTGTGATYALACHLWNQADNNNFTGCTFNVPANTTSTTCVPFSLSGSSTSATTAGVSGNNNVVDGCTMNSGYYNTCFVGNSTGNATGNVLKNSTLQDFYFYGSYNLYNTGMLISNNTIQRPNRTTLSTFYGIYLSSGNLNFLVEKNKIKNPFGAATTNTGSAYGVYGITAATSGNEHKIQNNLITDMNSSGTIYGIYTTSYMKAYHNTIVLNQTAATGTTTTYGLYCAGTAGNDIRNNIVFLSRGGTGIKYNVYVTSPAGVTINNNDYINTSTGGTNYIGYYSVGYATLTAWKAANASAWDQLSVSIDPLFTSSTNFLPTNAAYDNLGAPVGVLDDIINVTRSTTNPDLGAYEYLGAPCTSPPTPGTATTTPSTAVCGGSSITLSLIGNSTGYGQTYQWESSPTTGGPYAPSSGVLGGANYSFNATATGYFRCKITCGTGVAYSTEVAVNVNPAMPGGFYTIDASAPTGGSNFATFNAAVNAMLCGISGPVVFDVAAGSGPYVEQVMIPEIPGASASNTITFNGNGETLSFSSSNSVAPSTLELRGTDWVRINTLTVEATGATYALACHLWNQADNNIFTGCIFNVPANTTSTTAVPFSVSGSVSSATTSGISGNNNTVDGCTMFSGYYNTVFYGNSTGAATGNKVINCNLRDFYYYGSYNVYQTGMIISNNIVERPTRTTLSGLYCIYASTGTSGFLIEKNKIRNMWAQSPSTTGSQYSIYIGAASTLGNETRIINNTISGNDFNGSIYGIYAPGYAYINMYHNTITMVQPSSTGTANTYGIYAYGTNTNIKNNIIHINRPGQTGTQACLYMTTAFTGSCNYNDLLMQPTSTTAFTGYLTSGYQTLANWQAANSLAWDQNSVAVDPLYANYGGSDLTPNAGTLDNLGTPVGVTTDILGTSRSATTPDMGAYEYTPITCAGTPTAGTATAGLSMACAASFALNLTGSSIGLGISFQWQSSPAGAGVWTNLGSSQLSSNYYTTQSVATDYRCIVSCSNSGLSATSTVVSVGQNTFMGCYCIPPVSYPTSDEDILGVSMTSTVGTVSQTSICAALAPGANSVAGAYSNYMSNTPLSAEQGTTVNFTLSLGVCGTSPFSNGAAIFIDFNQNGSYADAGEKVFVEAATVSTPLTGRTLSGSFVIPFGATVGTTGLRVMDVEGSSGASITPCMTIGYGETEDYLVNITAAPICTGNPTPGTIVGVNNACTAPFTLTLSGNTTGSGITYQWQSSPAGTNTWTNIGSAQTSPSITVTQTASTDYQCLVDCAGNTVNTSILSVTQNSAISCYCVPVGTNATYYIAGVTTTGGVTNINNTPTTTDVTSQGYSDYHNTISLSAAAGAAISGTLAWGSVSTYTFHYRVYIDWNQDGDFADAGEDVFTQVATYTATNAPFSFTIPGAQAAGTYRMRIRNYYIGDDGSCNSSTYGEAEDYNVVVLPPCSSATAATIGTTSYAVCSGSTVTITATTGTALAGTSYQWQESATAGGPYTNVTTGTGGTTPTYTTAALTTTKYYVLNTICANCGPCNALSNEATVNINSTSAPTATNVVLCTSPGLSPSSVATTAGANSTGAFTWYSASSGGTIMQNPGFGALQSYYTNNFSSSTLTNSFISGSAVISSGKCQLTPTTLLSQAGGLTVGASGVNSDKYQIDFDITTGATGLADGLSYSFSDDGDAASVTPTTAERGTGSKLRLSFDAYDAIGTTAAMGVYLIYGTTVQAPGQTVGTNGVLAYSTNTSWVGVANSHATLSINALGQATVSVGGTTLFTNVQLPASFLTADKSTWTHIFKARSGGVAGDFAIDNVAIQASLPTTGFTTYNTNISATTTFYVSERGVNGCTSTRTPVVATVAPITAVTATPASSTVCAGASVTLTGGGAGTGGTYAWTGGVTNAVAFVPASTSTYTVTGTNTSGCTKTAVSTITVTPLPNVTATPATTSVCAGGSVTLVGGGATSYSWTGGVTNNVAFVPSTTTTYTVTGTASGCSKTATAVVTVNPIPTITATAINATICSGDNVTLTGGGAGAGGFYTWTGGVTDGVAFAPTATSTYTVTGTTAAGCSSSATKSITVNICSSIVNLKLFIEGYYLGSSTMTTALANEGVGTSTTNVDEVTVELKDATTYATVASVNAMLHTDGTATATFPTAPSGSFYIAVTHRNALETWSATAQTVGTTPLTYDFSNASTKAYSDGSPNNMREIEPGVWAFWSGDIFKDGSIDGSDGSALDNDSDAGAFGYFATDLNGDGSIDGSDYPFFNNNADASIYSQHP